jgi:hypothetical protein
MITSVAVAVGKKFQFGGWANIGSSIGLLNVLAPALWAGNFFIVAAHSKPRITSAVQQAGKARLLTLDRYGAIRLTNSR